MTDIIERLRYWSDHPPAIMFQAADEIERLREEFAMLKRAKFCDEENIAEQLDEIEQLREQNTEFLIEINHLVEQCNTLMAENRKLYPEKWGFSQSGKPLSRVGDS